MKVCVLEVYSFGGGYYAMLRGNIIVVGRLIKDFEVKNNC